MTSEAAAFVFCAVCFTAVGYLLARAVDAMRSELADFPDRLSVAWDDDEDVR